MVYNKEARSLEEAFFLKRDTELMEEMKRQEKLQTRKRALKEVSGITDEDVLNELVEHEIQPETLAAFSLVPIIEVAWADGTLQPKEREAILQAIEETGITKESIAFRLMEEWLEQRPAPRLLQVWKEYAGALVRELDAEASDGLRRTVIDSARSVAEAAGGFLGFGRISGPEEKMLQELESAFQK